jgi:hypothetical protein
LNNFFVLDGDKVKWKLSSNDTRKMVDEIFRKNSKVPSDIKKQYYEYRLEYAGVKLKEAAVKSPDFIVTSIPADAIPPVNISKADVGLGLSMFDTLGRGWTLNNKDYKLDYHNGKVALVLTKQGKLAVRVKSGHDPKYVQKIEKFANDYLSKYAKDIKK